MKKWINRLEMVLASGAMCIAVLATFLNVMLRYFFNRPIYQAEEIATSMFVWLVFIGAGVCYGEKMHIGIDCLVNLFPAGLRRVIETITGGAMILITAVMTHMSALFTLRAGAKLTAALRMPYSWIDAAAALGFFFMFLHAVDFFVADIKELIRPSLSEGGEV